MFEASPAALDPDALGAGWMPRPRPPEPPRRPGPALSRQAGWPPSRLPSTARRLLAEREARQAAGCTQRSFPGTPRRRLHPRCVPPPVSLPHAGSAGCQQSPAASCFRCQSTACCQLLVLPLNCLLLMPILQGMNAAGFVLCACLLPRLPTLPLLSAHRWRHVMTWR